MEFLSSLLDSWGTWIVGVGAVGGLLGWAVGLPSVLKILSVLIDVLSPIVKMVTSAIAGAATWLWRNVCWPALEDIFDNWRTAAFCISLCIGIVWFMSSYMDVKLDNVVDQLSTCQNEVTKLKKMRGATPSQDWFWRLW